MRGLPVFEKAETPCSMHSKYAVSEVRSALMLFNLMFLEPILSLFKLRQLCAVGVHWRLKGELRPPSLPLFEWRQLDEAC